ncbi:hypothetical protein PFISCL1PPCAC_8528, partial [Pristionchus fissidentatus]
CIASFCTVGLPICYLLWISAKFVLAMYITVICAFLVSCILRLQINYRPMFFVCAPVQCNILLVSVLSAEFWPAGHPSAFVALILFSIGQMSSLIMIRKDISERWTTIVGLLFMISMMVFAPAMEAPLTVGTKQALFGASCVALLNFGVCASTTMHEKVAFGMVLLFLVPVLVCLGITEAGIIVKKTAGPLMGIFG